MMLGSVAIGTVGSYVIRLEYHRAHHLIANGGLYCRNDDLFVITVHRQFQRRQIRC